MAAKTGKNCTIAINGGTAVSALYSLTPPSNSLERIDVTTLDSGTYKQYIAPDFVDGGQVSFTVDYTGQTYASTTGAVIYIPNITKTLTFPATLASETPDALTPNSVAKLNVTLNVNGAVSAT